MHAIMNVLRRTWLATTLFVVVSTTVWWKWLDWGAARDHLFSTLFLSPVIWWLAIGRKHPPRLLRGLAAGALTGLLTQILPDMPTLLPVLAHPGAGDGEAQAAAVATLVVYLMIASGAIAMGGLIGLVTTTIERRVQQT